VLYIGNARAAPPSHPVRSGATGPEPAVRQSNRFRNLQTFTVFHFRPDVTSAFSLPKMIHGYRASVLPVHRELYREKLITENIFRGIRTTFYVGLSRCSQRKRNTCFREFLLVSDVEKWGIVEIQLIFQDIDLCSFTNGELSPRTFKTLGRT